MSKFRSSGAVIMTRTARAVQDDAEFFAQRGFGQRIGSALRPALIIIDMLKAFTDESAMLDANLDNEIAAIIPLLTAAHDRGVPVIFSTVLRRCRSQGCRHRGAEEGRDDAQSRRPRLGGGSEAVGDRSTAAHVQS